MEPLCGSGEAHPRAGGRHQGRVQGAASDEGWKATSLMHLDLGIARIRRQSRLAGRRWSTADRAGGRARGGRWAAARGGMWAEVAEAEAEGVRQRAGRESAYVWVDLCVRN